MTVCQNSIHSALFVVVLRFYSTRYEGILKPLIFSMLVSYLCLGGYAVRAQEYTPATPGQRALLEDTLHEYQINNYSNYGKEDTLIAYRRGALLDAAIWSCNGKEYATILALDTALINGRILKDTIKEATGTQYYFLSVEGNTIYCTVVDGGKRLTREVFRKSYYAEKYPQKWIVYNDARYFGTGEIIRKRAIAVALKMREKSH